MSSSKGSSQATMRAFDKIDMIVTDTYNPKASIANNKTVKSPTASDICGSSSGFRTNVRSVPSTTPTIDSPSLLTQSARTDFLPTNLFRLNEGEKLNNSILEQDLKRLEFENSVDSRKEKSIAPVDKDAFDNQNKDDVVHFIKKFAELRQDVWAQIVNLKKRHDAVRYLSDLYTEATTGLEAQITDIRKKAQDDRVNGNRFANLEEAQITNAVNKVKVVMKKEIENFKKQNEEYKKKTEKLEKNAEGLEKEFEELMKRLYEGLNKKKVQAKENTPAPTNSDKCSGRFLRSKL